MLTTPRSVNRAGRAPPWPAVSNTTSFTIFLPDGRCRSSKHTNRRRRSTVVRWSPSEADHTRNRQAAIIRRMSEPTSTLVSRVVDAPPEAVYRAFLDQAAVVAWLPPGSMTGVVHAYDAREGGAFSMSLVYPESERSSRGKTTERTDTFRGRFVELVPNERIVWATRFDSADPSFAGEMTVRWMLEPTGSATKVTVLCENIPLGIRPQDNEAGCRATLEKLAAFLGG